MPESTTFSAARETKFMSVAPIMSTATPTPIAPAPVNLATLGTLTTTPPTTPAPSPIFTAAPIVSTPTITSFLGTPSTEPTPTQAASQPPTQTEAPVTPAAPTAPTPTVAAIMSAAPLMTPAVQTTPTANPFQEKVTELVGTYNVGATGSAPITTPMKTYSDDPNAPIKSDPWGRSYRTNYGILFLGGDVTTSVEDVLSGRYEKNWGTKPSEDVMSRVKAAAPEYFSTPVEKQKLTITEDEILNWKPVVSADKNIYGEWTFPSWFAGDARERILNASQNDPNYLLSVQKNKAIYNILKEAGAQNLPAPGVVLGETGAPSYSWEAPAAKAVEEKRQAELASFAPQTSAVTQALGTTQPVKYDAYGQPEGSPNYDPLGTRHLTGDLSTAGVAAKNVAETLQVKAFEGLGGTEGTGLTFGQFTTQIAPLNIAEGTSSIGVDPLAAFKAPTETPTVKVWGTDNETGESKIFNVSATVLANELIAQKEKGETGPLDIGSVTLSPTTGYVSLKGTDAEKPILGQSEMALKIASFANPSYLQAASTERAYLGDMEGETKFKSLYSKFYDQALAGDFAGAEETKKGMIETLGKYSYKLPDDFKDAVSIKAEADEKARLNETLQKLTGVTGEVVLTAAPPEESKPLVSTEPLGTFTQATTPEDTSAPKVTLASAAQGLLDFVTKPGPYAASPSIAQLISDKKFDNSTFTYGNVGTGSMAPFIQRGSGDVTIQRASPSDIKVGDVVLWQESQEEIMSSSEANVPSKQAEILKNLQLGLPTSVEPGLKQTGGIFHQVIWTDGKNFITQGTNNATPDNRLLSFADNYVGKVVFDNETQQKLTDFYSKYREGKSNISEVLTTPGQAGSSVDEAFQKLTGGSLTYTGETAKPLVSVAPTGTYASMETPKPFSIVDTAQGALDFIIKPGGYSASVPTITSGSAEQQFLATSGLAYGAGTSTEGTGYNEALAKLGTLTVGEAKPIMSVAPSGTYSSTQDLSVPKGATALEAIQLAQQAAAEKKAELGETKIGAGSTIGISLPGVSEKGDVKIVSVEVPKTGIGKEIADLTLGLSGKTETKTALISATPVYEFDKEGASKIGESQVKKINSMLEGLVSSTDSGDYFTAGGTPVTSKATLIIDDPYLQKIALSSGAKQVEGGSGIMSSKNAFEISADTSKAMAGALKTDVGKELATSVKEVDGKFYPLINGEPFMGGRLSVTEDFLQTAQAAKGVQVSDQTLGLEKLQVLKSEENLNFAAARVGKTVDQLRQEQEQIKGGATGYVYEVPVDTPSGMKVVSLQSTDPSLTLKTGTTLLESTGDFFESMASKAPTMAVAAPALPIAFAQTLSTSAEREIKPVGTTSTYLTTEAGAREAYGLQQVGEIPVIGGIAKGAFETQTNIVNAGMGGLGAVTEAAKEVPVFGGVLGKGFEIGTGVVGFIPTVYAKAGPSVFAETAYGKETGGANIAGAGYRLFGEAVNPLVDKPIETVGTLAVLYKVGKAGEAESAVSAAPEISWIKPGSLTGQMKSILDFKPLTTETTYTTPKASGDVKLEATKQTFIEGDTTFPKVQESAVLTEYAMTGKVTAPVYEVGKTYLNIPGAKPILLKELSGANIIAKPTLGVEGQVNVASYLSDQSTSGVALSKKVSEGLPEAEVGVQFPTEMKTSATAEGTVTSYNMPKAQIVQEGTQLGKTVPSGELPSTGSILKIPEKQTFSVNDIRANIEAGADALSRKPVNLPQAEPVSLAFEATPSGKARLILEPVDASLVGKTPKHGVYGVEVTRVPEATYNKIYEGRPSMAHGEFDPVSGNYKVDINAAALKKSSMGEQIMANHEVHEAVGAELLKSGDSVPANVAPKIVHNWQATQGKFAFDSTSVWVNQPLKPGEVRLVEMTKENAKAAGLEPYGAEYIDKYKDTFELLQNQLERANPISGEPSPYAKFTLGEAQGPSAVSIKYKAGTSEVGTAISPSFLKETPAQAQPPGVKPLGMEPVSGVQPLEGIASTPTPRFAMKPTGEWTTSEAMRYVFEGKQPSGISTPEVMRTIDEIASGAKPTVTEPLAGIPTAEAKIYQSGLSEGFGVGMNREAVLNLKIEPADLGLKVIDFTKPKELPSAAAPAKALETRKIEAITKEESGRVTATSTELTDLGDYGGIAFGKVSGVDITTINKFVKGEGGRVKPLASEGEVYLAPKTKKVSGVLKEGEFEVAPAAPKKPFAKSSQSLNEMFREMAKKDEAVSSGKGTEQVEKTEAISKEKAEAEAKAAAKSILEGDVVPRLKQIQREAAEIARAEREAKAAATTPFAGATRIADILKPAAIAAPKVAEPKPAYKISQYDVPLSLREQVESTQGAKPSLRTREGLELALQNIDERIAATPASDTETKFSLMGTKAQLEQKLNQKIAQEETFAGSTAASIQPYALSSPQQQYVSPSGMQTFLPQNTFAPIDIESQATPAAITTITPLTTTTPITTSLPPLSIVGEATQEQTAVATTTTEPQVLQEQYAPAEQIFKTTTAQPTTTLTEMTTTQLLKTEAPQLLKTSPVEVALLKTYQPQTLKTTEIQKISEVPRIQPLQPTPGTPTPVPKIPPIIPPFIPPFIPRVPTPSELSPVSEAPSFGLSTTGIRKGRRNILADLLSVQYSQFKFGRATHGSAERYAPFYGLEQGRILTVEQMEENANKPAKQPILRTPTKPILRAPQPSYPQPKSKYPLPGKSSVWQKMAPRRR